MWNLNATLKASVATSSSTCLTCARLRPISSISSANRRLINKSASTLIPCLFALHLFLTFPMTLSKTVLNKAGLKGSPWLVRRPNENLRLDLSATIWPVCPSYKRWRTLIYSSETSWPCRNAQIDSWLPESKAFSKAMAAAQSSKFCSTSFSWSSTMESKWSSQSNPTW